MGLFFVRALLVLPQVLWAQEVQGSEPDPFSSGPDPFAEGEERAVIPVGQGDRKTATLFLRVEVFELPVKGAMELLDQELSGEAFRKTLLKMVAEKKAEIASMHATRFEAGSSVTMDGIVEDIYPTEYEPPETLPEGSPLLRPEEQLSPTERVRKVALTFASPTAFDTKNLGTTLEAEAKVANAEQGMWDLVFNLTEVSHLKDCSWVEGTVTMPIFKVNSVMGRSRVKDGAWNLWSCQAPAGEDGSPDLSGLRVVLANLKQLKR